MIDPRPRQWIRSIYKISHHENCGRKLVTRQNWKGTLSYRAEAIIKGNRHGSSGARCGNRIVKGRAMVAALDQEPHLCLKLRRRHSEISFPLVSYGVIAENDQIHHLSV